MVTEKTTGLSTEWLKKQLDFLRGVKEGREYTAKEAKAQFDIDIEPDWKIRPEATAEGVRFSYVSPEGWQFKNISIGETGEVEDYLAVSPLGEQFTRAEYEAPQAIPQDLEAAQRRAMLGVTEQFPGEVPPPERVQAEERRETLGIAEAFPGEAPPPEIMEFQEQRFEEQRETLRNAAVVLSYAYQPEVAYTAAQVTDTLSSLRDRLRADPADFMGDLYLRTWRENAEDVLRLLGVPEDGIQNISRIALDFDVERIKTERAIETVFPGFNSEDLANLMEENPSLFIEKLQTGNSRRDKENMLRRMGFSNQEIASVLRFRKAVIPVDGISQQVTIDYVNERVYGADGEWLGDYDPITKEFTRATAWDKIADLWNTFRYGLMGLIPTGKDFALRMLPELAFPDVAVGQSKITGMSDEKAEELGLTYTPEEVEISNAKSQEIRGFFREIAIVERQKYEEWVDKHAEFKPNPVYEAGPMVHPELWTDPNWWAYEMASMGPVSGTAMFLGLGTTLITKNRMAGAAAASAFIAPVEMEAIRQDLLNEGVGEKQAAELASTVGLAVASVEYAGSYIALLRMLPGLRRIPREVGKQVVKLTVRRLARKGLTTFTVLQFTETMEEVMQEALGNVAVMLAGEDRSLFENIPQLIPKVTAGVVPFSLLGTGVSMISASPSASQTLTDVQKKALNWVQDAKTGKWYQALKGEAGFIGMPGAFGEEQPAEVTAETFLNTVQVGDKIVRYGDEHTVVSVRREFNPETGLVETTSANIVREEGQAPDQLDRWYIKRLLAEGNLSWKPLTQQEASNLELANKIETLESFIGAGILGEMSEQGRKEFEAQKDFARKQLEELRKTPVTEPTEPGEVAPTPEVAEVEATARNYPVVNPGETVDGRIIREETPNQDSIEATLEDYEILEGIREVPLSVFPEARMEKPETELSRSISESGEINPLIVVIDNKGPYILEGANRFDALVALNAKSFPAQVVIDRRLVPKPEPTIPAIAQEPGQPEAGLQPSMLEEVTGREVRPPGRGRVTQVSMEDQLRLEEARRKAEEAEEANAEAEDAYKAQAEIEGIRFNLQSDPVAQHRVWVGKSKKGKDLYRGLDWFISLREQTFPSYFTLKQANWLKPRGNFMPWMQKGTKEYNRVPREVVLDELADSWGMTPEEVGERVMQIREEKRRVEKLEARIDDRMSEIPLETKPELTPAEVKDNWETLNKPRYTIKQADALNVVFADYLNQPSVLSAWELTRELRRESRSQRAQNLRARSQQLLADRGLTTKEAMEQAIRETLSGELPSVTTDYLSGLTEDMREALYAKVAHVLKNEPFEMASTISDLTNALRGKPIPRDPGTRGGSAYTRLQRVFNDRPKVFKAIDKMASENKPLDEVVEGLFHEVGRDPIPLNQETLEYLRSFVDTTSIPQPEIPGLYREAEVKELVLKPEVGRIFDKPSDLTVRDLRSPEDMAFARAELELETRWANGELTFDEFELARREARDKAYGVPTVTRFEKTIEDSFDQKPLWPNFEEKMLVKVLKEIRWAPLDIGNMLRAFKTTLDNSFLRQAKLLLSGHPRLAWDVHNKSWQAMFSLREAEASNERIERRPWFPVYEEVRIRFGYDPLRVGSWQKRKGTARYRTSEEFGFPTRERWLPRMVSSLPIIKPFERAFVTGTNESVAGVLDLAWKLANRRSEKIASREMTLPEGETFDMVQEFADWQQFLGDAIQRAALPKQARELAPFFNAFMFAARSKLGRFLFPIHLTGLRYAEGKVRFNPRVAREAWKDFLLMQGLFGGTMLLGDWLGLWETEDDPRNAEFMSARIGNTRIDPWAGYRQFVVLYARLITETGISSVTGGEYEVDKVGAVQSFLRNSASPFLSTLLEFWTGRNFLGQAINFSNADYYIEKALPFLLDDMWEAFEDAGWGRVGLTFIPAIYGEGVQTYTGDWEDNWQKLGLRKYVDVPEVSYTTQDFYADHSAEFTGVDPETLTARKGFPPYIRALVEVKVIKDELDTLPSERLIDIQAKLAEGKSFGDLRKLWQERRRLVEADDDAEYTVSELQPDGTYKDVTYKGKEAVAAFDRKEIAWVEGVTTQGTAAALGNISQRQYALLMEYWSLDEDERGAFLEKHEDELGVNPRRQYLINHPKENAQLAIFGQAKIMTKEAFSEFKRLTNELDIPDAGLPEMTMPPETSVDTHWEYQDMVAEGKHGSWEAQLLLLKDARKAEKAGVESYAEWAELTLTDTPVESLEIKTEETYREVYNKLNDEDHPDWVGNLDDEEKDKDGLTERDRAIAKLKATKIGDMTYRQLEKKVEAIEKGTSEEPIPDEIVDAHISYHDIRRQEDTLHTALEANLFLVDNDGYRQFRYNPDVWTDPLTEEWTEQDIARWRLLVENRDKETEYTALSEKYEDMTDAQINRMTVPEGMNRDTWALKTPEQKRNWLTRRDEATYLEENEDYAEARYKIDAYELGFSDEPDRNDISDIDRWVEFNQLPKYGYWRDHYKLDNSRFFNEVTNLQKAKGQDPWDKPENIPAAEYDLLYEQYEDDFREWESYGDPESPDYIENSDERARRRQQLILNPDGTYNEFGLARLERDAHYNLVPEQQVNNYVGFYRIQGEGKPDDYPENLSYWEDNWFMLENPGFHNEVWVDLLGNEPYPTTPKVTEDGVRYLVNEDGDASKTPPTRELGRKYIEYNKITNNQAARDQYRLDNPDLDRWGVAVGIWTRTMSERRRRLGLTPSEKFQEELDEGIEEFREWLEDLG